MREIFACRPARLGISLVKGISTKSFVITDWGVSLPSIHSCLELLSKRKGMIGNSKNASGLTGSGRVFDGGLGGLLPSVFVREAFSFAAPFSLFLISELEP